MSPAEIQELNFKWSIYLAISDNITNTAITVHVHSVHIELTGFTSSYTMALWTETGLVCGSPPSLARSSCYDRLSLSAKGIKLILHFLSSDSQVEEKAHRAEIIHSI